MLFDISSILADPLSFLTSLLISLPGVLLALSIHECAHAWVALRCGDDTAYLMGRVTLNPTKHIDPFGFLCMLLVGFGWARPVPVNPNKFRSYRRDDLKVAVAGVTANLCLFFVCFFVLSLVFTGALAKLPSYESGSEAMRAYYTNRDAMAEAYVVHEGDEVQLWMEDGYYYTEDILFKYSYYMYDEVIEPAFGRVVSILYQMILHCMFINLSLAVFNLIPLPPLDGYHVLNDLVLKQDLFAQMRTQRIAVGILIALIMLGNYMPQYDIISIAIEGVRSGVLNSLSIITKALAHLLGTI